MPEVVLGIDYGAQRTGIAVGNTASMTATPLTTVQAHNGKPNWSELEKIINEWRPKRVILGLPADDPTLGEHPMKDSIERFARQLEGRFHLPIETINEHFSSAEANERLIKMRQQGRKRKINKAEIDAQAAVIMIEQWMANQHD